MHVTAHIQSICFVVQGCFRHIFIHVAELDWFVSYFYFGVIFSI